MFLLFFGGKRFFCCCQVCFFCFLFQKYYREVPLGLLGAFLFSLFLFVFSVARFRGLLGGHVWNVDALRLKPPSTFYENIINTSAVSLVNLGSTVTFASCVIHRPLVFILYQVQDLCASFSNGVAGLRYGPSDPFPNTRTRTFPAPNLMCLTAHRRSR